MQKKSKQHKVKFLKPAIVIILILVFDQVFKIWIKTNMIIGEEHHIIGNWFILHFTENNGIAFGLEFWGENGKIFLTIFRIIAAFFIGYFIVSIVKKGYSQGFVICVSLIFAGAVGNIIDSIFYGVLFNYESLLQGRVVDMLYFPIIDTYYPDWFPLWGGNRFIFFRPVFNISDSAITTGTFSILLFYRKTLKTL
ncbi:MAG: lipoprotein signal peptidase [Bacteroidota bacterium]|nr:lipoprotein signal peptidase [Bacteroidota bacterium]